MAKRYMGAQPTTEPHGAYRIEWLDGVRALAALFVVLHHVWLMTYGGYPGNNGPWTTDWLIYGHLAVSVFIVVSGFSLTLSPARHGLALKDGGSGFLRRRFWRIVPPYWAALALSVGLIALGWIQSPSGNPVRLKDVLVHFFLVQDAVGNTSPNGVFWSIAVEWHIYFLFPLLLLSYRRFGIPKVLFFVAVLITAQHVVGLYVPLIGQLNRFTPVYLILFALGTAAAAQTKRETGGRGYTLIGVLLLAAFLVTAILLGSENVIANYFWIDLVVGSAMAAMFVAFTRGRISWLARFLALKPLIFLGQYAFSLYLVHALVLELIRSWVIQPLDLSGGSAFWVLLSLGLPGALGGAYLFFLLFERPFLTIRSFKGLLEAIRARALQPWAAHARLADPASSTDLSPTSPMKSSES